MRCPEWNDRCASEAAPIALRPFLWNMRWLTWLSFLPLITHAQTVITGRVLDAATKEPLPYCSVGIIGSRIGTITNEEGAFAIHADVSRDTLTFSFVGYFKRNFPASALMPGRDVLLNPSTTELRELEVRPENDALYELVARCAKRIRRSSGDVAKLYFEMNTHMDGQPMEVLECFYNARIDGPHIEELDLKHGRVGIAPLDNRYFVSLDMTKAMSLFDVRNDKVKFPMNPLLWTTVRSLRKRYRIEQLDVSDDGVRVEHLRLTPRDSGSVAGMTGNAYFTMELWMDATSAEPNSIALTCTDCRTHPFVPLKPEDRIEHLDMQVRLTFKNEAQRNLLHHLELAYDMRYRDRAGERRVKTDAVMHLFDHGRSFILPLFEYDREQNDYRKITFQPYDSTFWATSPTLVRTAQHERDHDFFAEHGLLTGSTRIVLQRGTFFESNYAWWSPKKRISLKSLPGSVPPATAPRDIRSRGAAIPISQINLEAQIYLDIDTTGGNARHFSATVFDGFRSYYRLPEQPYTDVFINLYFDLCEMERRALEVQLAGTGTDVARMRTLHAQAVENMQRTRTLYLKETQLGEDAKALQRWNEKVKEALGIDNMAMFGLQP